MSKKKNPLYRFTNRIIAPIYRLEYIDDLDVKKGSPFNLIKTTGQRMVSVMQMGPGVAVEIATKFSDDGSPCEHIVVVLKPGEAMRLAGDLLDQAHRACDQVAYAKNEALQEWEEIQDSLNYAYKNNGGKKEIK